MPFRSFDVRFKGIDIFDEEKLFNGKRIEGSDISYESEYQLVEVAHYDYLSLDEFMAKSEEYQGWLIAHYRAHRQIEAVLMEDSKIKQSRREALAKSQQMGAQNAFPH